MFIDLRREVNNAEVIQSVSPPPTYTQGHLDRLYSISSADCEAIMVISLLYGPE